MNRILKFIKKDKPNEFLKRPQNDPKNCGFCGKDIQASHFRAWTRPQIEPTVVLCMHCIERYAVYATMTRHVGLYFKPSVNYDPLRDSLRRRLEGEAGSKALKETIIEIGIELLIRVSALQDGAKKICPKTGISLDIMKMAIVCKDHANAMSLFGKVFKELGFFLSCCNPEQLESGKDYEDLIEGIGNTTWASLAVHICSGYAKPNTKASVIYLVNDVKEVPEDIRLVFANSGVNG